MIDHKTNKINDKNTDNNIDNKNTDKQHTDKQHTDKQNIDKQYSKKQSKNNSQKIAVVLFNLGGPASLTAIKPFLFNLFYDKAIINLPNPMRFLIAKLISKRRGEGEAKEIYKLLGGKSPINEQTDAQTKLLEKNLQKQLQKTSSETKDHNNNDNNPTKDNNPDYQVKCFFCMRYAPPMADEVVQDVKSFAPDKIILLPLYPQSSTTTSFSSFDDWYKHVKKHNISHIASQNICCFPDEENFIDSHVELLQNTLKKIKHDNYRILFSAHGLPVSIIKKGDPYQYQVEHTVKHILEKMKSKYNLNNPDYTICYQSKVGPMKWLEPSTEHVIEQTAKDKKAIVIVPVAFVSEHSETLVELDIEYKEVADEAGCNEYYRVPTLSSDKIFIESLTNLCLDAIKNDNIITSKNNNYYLKRICPEKFNKCRCVLS